MAVKPVYFAESQVKVGSANLFACLMCVEIKTSLKKKKKKALLHHLHSWVSSRFIKLLEAWLPPPFLLPTLRAEWAEGFAYTAEHTSLQNLDFTVGHTFMPPGAHPGHGPSLQPENQSLPLSTTQQLHVLMESMLPAIKPAFSPV